MVSQKLINFQLTITIIKNKGNMMKVLLLSSLLIVFTACSGGGNGGGSPAGPTYGSLTHNQLAEAFVRELNLDADFGVTLVKSSTLQDDFIVIYDPYTDSYDAIDIQTYNPNYDVAADFYYANSARNYFDLAVIPGHYEVDYDYTIIGYDYYGDAIWGYEPYEVWVPTRYQDLYTGVTFEKTGASSKDLAKVVALKEVAEIQKSAEFISSEFGLSLDRSKEIAGLQAHWKKAAKKAMTNAEVDNFASELLGFSLTEGMSAYQASAEGDSSSLNALVERSANHNDITPEHANGLVTKVFGL